LQDDDDEKFAITLPGSPLTNDNYFDENPKCGDHVMNKALKALGVLSLEGLKVVGASTLEMKDFWDLFRLDIDDFKKSDNYLVSLVGAVKNVQFTRLFRTRHDRTQTCLEGH
jgi:hypothetical protein